MVDIKNILKTFQKNSYSQHTRNISEQEVIETNNGIIIFKVSTYRHIKDRHIDSEHKASKFFVPENLLDEHKEIITSGKPFILFKNTDLKEDILNNFNQLKSLINLVISEPESAPIMDGKVTGTNIPMKKFACEDLGEVVGYDFSDYISNYANSKNLTMDSIKYISHPDRKVNHLLKGIKKKAVLGKPYPVYHYPNPYFNLKDFETSMLTVVAAFFDKKIYGFPKDVYDVVSIYPDGCLDGIKAHQFFHEPLNARKSFIMQKISVLRNQIQILKSNYFP